MPINEHPVFQAIEDKNLVIYGFGFLGRWVHNFISEAFRYNCPVIDQQHIFEDDIQVLPLNAIASFQGLLLVCARHHIRSVGEMLDENRVRWISADRFFLDYLIDGRDEIVDALSHDSKSISTYTALEEILSCGWMCKVEHLVTRQYFEPPEFFPTFAESFVDAGAFCGDTLENFLNENLGTFRDYYAFEPGKLQFEALTARRDRLAREWGIKTERINLINKGLGSKKTVATVQANSNDLMSHTLSNSTDSKQSVEIVSLDLELGRTDVSFLKSDIEGMDLDFLHGAKNTIKRCRPKMAISCYHYPSDLLEMIRYIRGLNLNYKFKLRHHANVIGDYVLYAY